MTGSRVTQLDVARKARVGRSTVSLALKDHPRLARATKERILAVARRLGYEPDPMLSALAVYRSSKRPQTFHGTLAWLVNSHPGYAWESVPYYSDYFSGASERAREHGYRLETFLIGRDLTPQRVASVLRARNITGILLCPQPRADMEMVFAWSDFAVVTFGYTLVKPLLHTVASAHYLNTRHAIRELAARGYRRIGLMIDRTTDQRCGSNVLAAYLVEQQSEHDLAPIPPLFAPFIEPSSDAAIRDNNRRELSAYVHRHKIDALVTSDYHALATLEAEKIRVPGDIGVAGLSLPSSRGPLGGIVEDSRQIGSVALDLLTGMVQRGERGIPRLPIRTHIEGIWHEGRSLRPVE